MVNVQQHNENRPRRWEPSPVTVAQILGAVNAEAYPPKPRVGVGAVARPGRP